MDFNQLPTHSLKAFSYWKLFPNSPVSRTNDGNLEKNVLYNVKKNTHIYIVDIKSESIYHFNVSYFQGVAKIKLDEKREVKCGFNLILMRALSVENNEELLLF